MKKFLALHVRSIKLPRKFVLVCDFGRKVKRGEMPASIKLFHQVNLLSRRCESNLKSILLFLAHTSDVDEQIVHGYNIPISRGKGK